MTNVATAQPEISLGRYGAVLLSRWRIVFLGVVVGLVAAVSYILFVPPTYVSTTTLSVFPITADPYASNRNNNNLLDMTAESTAARSFKVAELAAGALGGDWTAEDLRMSTSVAAGADKSTMTITVAAESEEMARRGAAAMADSYIRMRSQQAESDIDVAVQRDKDRIDSLREELSDAIRRSAAAKSGSPAAAEAAADQRIINVQIAALLTRVRSLEGIDTTGGVILNPAALTPIAVQPPRKLVLATGLAGGLLLGVIAAFASGSRRRVVRSDSDLRREFEIETLAILGEGEVTQEVATVAQRLLRFAVLDNARAIAVIFDQAVSAQSVLAEQIAADMQDSGTTTVITNSTLQDGSAADGLFLVPVAGNAARPARLDALRVSDIAILVVSAGATKSRDLKVLVEEASEMGARVVGAVLVSGKRGTVR